jgi:hypothetical protein
MVNPSRLWTQRRQIDAYTHMQGLTLDKVFVERSVSGSKPLSDRPGRYQSPHDRPRR